MGLKSSIRTGFGYVGVIVAGMVAFSYMGLNLQNIAIVAGALSVDVDFGLQSIVNNFISDLILLAERPIKVGDWIVVGEAQGYVRHINVRATEIETFDRQTVIVPNSDLISGVVKNWMHDDTSGCIILTVGVFYDSDPEQVRDIMMQIARDNSELLAYPAPVVYFMDFEASSLDFELRAYLAQSDYSLSVKSDLRFEIMRRFSEAGIEIPFPQRDLNPRDMDRLEDVIRGRGETSRNLQPTSSAAGETSGAPSSTPHKQIPSTHESPADADGDGDAV
ncbi:mechanosensitive ion channel domain-containing protein [Breoghania sp.]|uniref:mechanosensitive ion channel family protein n=1 Tax=Breoghania sp. TaxID=2065378 RepID=UPI00261AFCBB|nr:mechanosensitive ion channel domain-containing protein [Breoghania sp.]MDJ0931655.1 mechanosensitive ion channel [Breoghania sp.]